MIRPAVLLAPLSVLLVMTAAVENLAALLGAEVLLATHSERLHSLKELPGSPACHATNLPGGTASPGRHTTHCLGHLLYKSSRLFTKL